MLKKLEKIKNKIYWIDENGKRHDGVNGNIIGDVSDIIGDVSWISGNVNGIRGDIDECQITMEERKKGIDITDLIDCS